MDCFICSEKPIVELEYIDSSGMKQVEKRCEVCADAVRNNEATEIVNDTKLNEEKNESDSSNQGYTTFTSIHDRFNL